MQLYSEGNNYKLFQGDMLDLLQVIPEGSIDAVLTDPPYELNFMGKGWDNSGIAFKKDTWEKCLKALKPGGYLLAFGGSRTYHRIACAIEDAGFEIRDCIMWLYGSGMPKSMNIEKSINKIDGVEFKSKPAGGVGFMNTKDDGRHNTINQLEQVGESSERAKQRAGRGTCLKPSYESIIVARKPCEGSCTDNVIKYGVGGINIDECRVGDSGGTKKVETESCTDSNGIYGNGLNGGTVSNIDSGRFPANTILTYGDDDREEVCGGFPITKGGGKTKEKGKFGMCFGKGERDSKPMADGYEDEGSAARYFYCAKASRRDRDEGLPEGKHSAHPTVKPTSLMQYLVRLVTPNGGTVLDPFNGSGSTGKAVMYENKDRNKNYKYIGIELTEEYLPISKARIEYVTKQDDNKEQPPILFPDSAGYDEKNFTD